MTEFVQWDSVPKANSSGSSDEGKPEFLRLKTGKTYRIRPVFTPVKFFKYFHKKDGKLRTAVCPNPDTCPVRDRHPDLKKPALRYAVYVIDREDSKVKIMEAPQSVFRPIGSRFQINGKNPGGGKDGSDWNIRVSGGGLTTVYDVVFIEDTPLTQSEKDAIKVALGGDKEKLKKMYQSDTPEQIEEKLFGNASKKGAPAEAPEEVVEEEVEEKDDFVEEAVEAAKTSPKDDFDNNF